MTEAEVRSARVSGAAKKKIGDLVKKGHEYIEAKKMILRANFINPCSTTSKPHMPSELNQRHSKSSGPKASEIGRQHLKEKSGKEARLKETYFRETISDAKVAVAHESFPIIQLEQEKLKASEDAIIVAYEKVRRDWPQTHFLKCKHRLGYLVVICANDFSADWLKVPTFKPEGVFLKDMVDDNFQSLTPALFSSVT